MIKVKAGFLIVSALCSAIAIFAVLISYIVGEATGLELFTTILSCLILVFIASLTIVKTSSVDEFEQVMDKVSKLND